MEQLVESYGLLAVFVGTLLEGETVLVLGGFAAHRGYLSIVPVMLVAFVGSFAGDQVAFQLGRRRGGGWLERRERWRPQIERCRGLIERRGVVLILVFRFLYGLRTVLPFLWGTGRIPTHRFVLLDAVGAAIWSVAIGALGYAFGSAAEAMLGDLERYEGVLLLVIVALGAGVWGVHRWSRRVRPG